jgi:nitric-oxide synthase, bacterial
VPPISGALTPVFHRYYDVPDPTIRPAYLPPADTLRGHPRR